MAGTRTDDEYAALYQEHNGRLVAYARSLTGSAAVAEDLAAEAHFRVWRRIQAGHTVDNVAAYLTTTVRNLAVGLGRARHEIARDVTELPEDPALSQAAVQDPEQRASHVDLISRLLKELPDRWAKALWYAEVEDLPMEAVGAHIGASASTTAVVLTRARERLRQAFLGSQPGMPLSEECEPYWKQMPTIVRATASARRTKIVMEHCDRCEDCRARMLALTEANTRLPVLLGPALLGVVLGGGAWFLPTVGATSAGAAKLGAAGRAGSKARHARISVRTRLLKHGLSPTKSVVIGSAAAVGIAATVATLALGSSNSPTHPPTASSAVTAQPTAAAAGTTNAASGPVVQQPAAAAPTTAAGTGTAATPQASAAAATGHSQPETQAAAASGPTTPTNAATRAAAIAPTPVSTTETTPDAFATATVNSPTPSPTLTPTRTTSSPQPTVTPTPTPTVTPAPMPTGTASATPTQTPTSGPSCTFVIYGVCIIVLTGNG